MSVHCLGKLLAMDSLQTTSWRLIAEITTKLGVVKNTHLQFEEVSAL
jgi:hypothetical protein